MPRRRLARSLTAAGPVLAEHKREFVSAETSQQVASTYEAVQAGRNQLQHLVADVMTKGVVDGFETVEIDQQKGSALGPLFSQDDVG